MKKFLTIALVGVTFLGAACDDGADIEKVQGAATTESTDADTDTTGTTTERSTTTAAPTTTTTTTPPSGTKENPDRLGAPYELSTDEETWHMKVDAVNFDGWPSIQAENQFNTAPPEGWRFMIVSTTMSYIEGSGASSPDWVASVTATGSANRIYEEYGQLPSGQTGCGVIPNDLANATELMPGGTVSGNVCIPVPDAEVVDGSVRLLVEPTFSFDDDEPIWITPYP